MENRMIGRIPVKNVVTQKIAATTWRPTLPRLTSEIWPDLPVTVM